MGKVTLDSLNMCDIIVRSLDVAKELGVLLDSQMTMISQIANVIDLWQLKKGIQ